jgi:glycosyltransferase involved in cell wall biosynthesis
VTAGDRETPSDPADVVLVGSYPPPHGGQSVHIQNLGDHLRKHGLRVRILNTGSNKQVRADGVVNVGNAADLLRALLTGPRPALVHVHVSGVQDYGKLGPVRAAAGLRRFPWVVTVHSGDSATRLQSAPWYRQVASRRLVAGAHTVICVNRATAEAMAPLNPSTVVVAPHSISFAMPAPLPSDVGAFIAGHSPLLTCVGLYTPVYSFDEAIELVAALRPTHPGIGLLLIGDLAHSDAYKARIERAGVAGHVKLCGNLGHDECLTAVRASSVFLRLTQYDGDSLSVREALALGVPVVATATDFRPDGVVLYRKGDLEGLTAKMRQVLASGARGGSVEGHSDNLEEVRRIYLAIMQKADGRR